jgi:hypothetical protein
MAFVDASTVYLQTLIKQDTKLEEIFDEIDKAIQKGDFNTTVSIYCIQHDNANDIVELLEKNINIKSILLMGILIHHFLI